MKYFLSQRRWIILKLRTIYKMRIINCNNKLLTCNNKLLTWNNLKIKKSSKKWNKLNLSTWAKLK